MFLEYKNILRYFFFYIPPRTNAAITLVPLLPITTTQITKLKDLRLDALYCVRIIIVIIRHCSHHTKKNHLFIRSSIRND